MITGWELLGFGGWLAFAFVAVMWAAEMRWHAHDSAKVAKKAEGANDRIDHLERQLEATLQLTAAGYVNLWELAEGEHFEANGREFRVEFKLRNAVKAAPVARRIGEAGLTRFRGDILVRTVER